MYKRTNKDKEAEVIVKLYLLGELKVNEEQLQQTFQIMNSPVDQWPQSLKERIAKIIASGNASLDDLTMFDGTLKTIYFAHLEIAKAVSRWLKQNPQTI